METIENRKRPGIIQFDFNLAQLPWWAIAIVLTALGFIYLLLSSQDYNDTFIFLTQGLYTTLRITFFSYIFATIIGLFTGLARVSKNPILYNVSTLYVELIRGIPLIKFAKKGRKSKKAMFSLFSNR